MEAWNCDWQMIDLIYTKGLTWFGLMVYVHNGKSLVATFLLF